jgi:signal transduction histidine kinase
MASPTKRVRVVRDPAVADQHSDDGDPDHVAATTHPGSRLDGERLRRLFDAGRSLSSELDLEVLLGSLLDAARDLTGARYAALGILDDRRVRLKRFITAGIDEAEHAAIGRLPQGHGVLGLLIREPKPLRLAEVGKHPQSYGLPSGHPPMATFLGVPIIVRGAAWGNVYLTEKAGGAEFDEADQEAVELLAGWAASAIDNARLYHLEQQRRTELERTVRALETTTEIARAVGGEICLDRVAELIVKRGRALVDARGVSLLLVVGAELEVAAVAGQRDRDRLGQRIPIAGSVSGEVLRSGRAELVDDAKSRLRLTECAAIDATSAILIPLVFQARPVGILGAFDRLVDGPGFTREDVRLLDPFAASAAIAVAMVQRVEAQGVQRSIDASEKERARWARELHDETLQELAALKFLLAAARRNPAPEAMARVVDDAVAQIDGGIKALRGIIADLRPAALDALGVGAALESLVERLRTRSELEITLSVDLAYESGRATSRHSPALEAAIYRICQEALTNVTKHAEASHVEVRTIERDSEIEIVIADDGRGFAPDDVDAGFGLIGIRERAALLRGSVTVDSAPGQGTRLVVTLRVDPRRRKTEPPQPAA